MNELKHLNLSIFVFKIGQNVRMVGCVTHYNLLYLILKSDLRLLISSYLKMSNSTFSCSSKVSKIILTGGGALLKGLKEKASLVFETPVEVADPFSKVEYPAFLEEVLKNSGPEFAVAIGLAIRKLQEI